MVRERLNYPAEVFEKGDTCFDIEHSCLSQGFAHLRGLELRDFISILPDLAVTNIEVFASFSWCSGPHAGPRPALLAWLPSTSDGAPALNNREGFTCRRAVDVNRSEMDFEHQRERVIGSAFESQYCAMP